MSNKLKGFFIILLLVAGIFLISQNSETLKKGIEISLQEDFKIKESLGQIFLIDNENKDITVSSLITVTSISLPCQGEIEQQEILGEKSIVVHCKKFESVCATADGVIESCENDKMTLRHNDGKLSYYYGAVCLLKKGDKVEKGESIGYAKGNVTYKLYENCVALNPMEYLP